MLATKLALRRFEVRELDERRFEARPCVPPRAAPGSGLPRRSAVCNTRLLGNGLVGSVAREESHVHKRLAQQAGRLTWGSRTALFQRKAQLRLSHVAFADEVFAQAGDQLFYAGRAQAQPAGTVLARPITWYSASKVTSAMLAPHTGQVASPERYRVWHCGHVMDESSRSLRLKR